VKNVLAERETYWHLRNIAGMEPEVYPSITIDRADQTAFDLPHFVDGDCDLDGSGLRPLRLKTLSQPFYLKFIFLLK
jgi:hypothetical protein